MSMVFRSGSARGVAIRQYLRKFVLGVCSLAVPDLHSSVRLVSLSLSLLATISVPLVPVYALYLIAAVGFDDPTSSVLPPILCLPPTLLASHTLTLSFSLV